MNSSEHIIDNASFWLPPGESKCIWMSAGIITYKLCDRKFNCEKCSLHKALIAGKRHPVKRRANRVAGV